MKSGRKSASRTALFWRSFLEAGQYHNELEPEQLEYAGRVAKVKAVEFFHGGDEIYTLEGVPGVWHEECLSAGPESKSAALLPSCIKMDEYRHCVSRRLHQNPRRPEIRRWILLDGAAE